MDQIKEHDAIYLGAVGWPTVPDHVSLWELLIPIRRNFQQYVNLNPVRLFERRTLPAAPGGAGEIDFWIVRENNEGEYSEIGGRLYPGTDAEMAIQENVFTRRGVGPGTALRLQSGAVAPNKHLTSATKSNGIIHTMPFWDERVKAMSGGLIRMSAPTSTTSIS